MGSILMLNIPSTGNMPLLPLSKLDNINVSVGFSLSLCDYSGEAFSK